MKLRALLAIALAGLALVLFGPASSAVAYPVGTCSTLSVSTTHPNPGEAITVTGSGFRPNVSVSLILRSKANASETYTLKTVVASGSGAFSTTIVMPDVTTNGGNYALIATTGYDTGNSCPADPFQDLTVGIGAVSSSSSNGGTTGSNGGGGTAYTGVNILLMVLAAGALIGTGVALNRKSTSKKLYTGEH